MIFALVGNQNCGKTTLFNALTGSNQYVGNWPGVTVERKEAKFEIGDDQATLVDLPGYGYAKVPKAEKERWGKLMEGYFASGRITLGILIVDARHAPTMNDVTMADYFLQTGCPFVVVANKMDKLKKSEIQKNLATIRTDLELPEEVTLVPFSAEKGLGRDELVKIILDAVKNA